jgi:general L-amino acid transport system substrate-binding protein
MLQASALAGGQIGHKMKLINRKSLSRCSIFAILAAGVAIALPSLACSAQTLAEVKTRGELICGVNARLLGFSFETEGGWRGFDVDLCRAVAIAVFGADKVKFVPLNATERFAALQGGEIDILSRNSTWTMLREAGFGIVFPAITYFDGQGFLVRKTFSATSVLELDNAKICVEASTATTSNLAEYFQSNNMRSEQVGFADKARALEAYDAGRCDAFTNDISELHADRLELRQPQDHQILPDIISKEPLGPVVRKGDEQWADVVKWTIFALINAEELGPVLS